MASCLSVTDYAVVLGKTAATEWALQLDVAPVPVSLAERDGHVVQFNYLADIAPETNEAGRIVQLIEKLRQQLSKIPDTDPVLLVLPEQLINESQLQTVLNGLHQAFPQLLSHHACQLFPYGRSAALMALAAARQLLAAGEQRVWIIGVDSPVSSVLQQLSSGSVSAVSNISSSVVWSEGAVAMCLSQSAVGLNCHFLASDATVNKQQDEPAIAQLFSAVATNIGSPLRCLYLADCGDDEFTARWQGHYSRLAALVNRETELNFTGFATGELGAAGGVYRLLHLYLGYLQDNEPGLTLQCEISDRLYRAVAVFSWQTASSTTDC